MNSTRASGNVITCLGLMLLLSACAVKTTVWQRSNTSAEEQRNTLAQCRACAKNETERDYARQQSYLTSTTTQNTYQQNMDAYQARKSSRNLLARCMKLKGYRPVQAGS